MIPIFIITCDRLEVLKKSIQSYYDCIKTPFKIVIVDFGSTYKPTQEYLKNLEHKKIKVYRKKRIHNKGNFGSIREIVQDYFKDQPASNYVVTDPDIVLDNIDGDILEVYAYLLKKLPRIVIAGPNLIIDDIPGFYPKKKDVLDWESQHYRKVRTIRYGGKDIKYILARLDTTFAMNRAGYPWHRHRLAARVLAPYAAKHLDWYLNPQHLTGDQKYYAEHASPHISNWSKIEKTELPIPRKSIRVEPPKEPIKRREIRIR